MFLFLFLQTAVVQFGPSSLSIELYGNGTHHDLKTDIQVKGIYTTKVGDHYSKTSLKRPLKKDQKIGLQDRLLLNAGQKYCRMPQRKHSAILSTFIKLPFTIKTFVLSIFKWPLKTGFTVFLSQVGLQKRRVILIFLFSTSINVVCVQK